MGTRETAAGSEARKWLEEVKGELEAELRDFADTPPADDDERLDLEDFQIRHGALTAALAVTDAGFWAYIENIGACVAYGHILHTYKAGSPYAPALRPMVAR